MKTKMHKRNKKRYTASDLNAFVDEIVMVENTYETHEEIMKRVKGNLNSTKLNDAQAKYYRTIRDNTITICCGPSGTSKTFTSTYASLSLLSDGVIDQIVLTKPIQEAGESLGFLPGGINDKINPYMESYYSTLHKLIGKDTTKILIDKGYILSKPLAYLRGDNLDRSIMLFDEIQNADMRQIMLWITRIGFESRAVGFGDISQYDIHSSKIAVKQFMRMVEGITKIGIFEFTHFDIVRNPILIEIVERYERLKYGHDKEEQLSV